MAALRSPSPSTSGHGFGQGGRRADGHQPPVDAFLDAVHHAASERGDDRLAAGQRLEHGQRERIV
jgi:hypothetical protein